MSISSNRAIAILPEQSIFKGVRSKNRNYHYLYVEVLLSDQPEQIASFGAHFRHRHKR